MRSSCRFTMVEMLVVIAIIAILSALLMPSLHKAIKTARQASCANNLRQISTAFAMYEQDNYGFFPPMHPNNSFWASPQWQDKLISPGYLTRQAVYVRHSQMSGNGGCPEMPEYDPTTPISYGINYFIGIKADRKRHTKTPSKTLLVADAIRYYLTQVQWHAWPHPNQTANNLFCDGHIASKFILDITINSKDPYWSEF